MFLNQISENIKVKMPEVYFISVDAERDTAQMLNKFTAYFNKDFIGIGGKQAESDKLSSFMNVIYERVYHKDGKQVVIKKNATVPDELKDSYLINHSADIYLINPAGQLHAIFPLPHDVDSFVQDITKVINSYD
jgi:protein SCO1/2